MLRLQYAALSDVGRVRKDNQDSGYAGPWLLTVCDGVGGAARGDIASSTAVQQLRRLDERPEAATGEDLLGLVSGALHRAHDRIGELVDEDPALGGTSTTATVALFDGERLAIGHVGDSRGYLLRDGTLSQLTKDHTFVQSLIDEGRITEAESRVHPHRNLILKALDGMHETEPDLFLVELQAGDRLLLCSDGASGVLDDARLAALLSVGSPDLATVELVRSSLEAGSSDNVTCVVADVVDDDGTPATDADGEELSPRLVGAAAELRRRPSRGALGGSLAGSLFRRSDDTDEIPAVPADLPAEVDFAIPADPLDPEAARYAPRPPGPFTWLRRVLALAVVVGLVWMAGAAAWTWTQRQYYVGEEDGVVVIFRGISADLPGISLSEPYETTNVEVDRLPDVQRRRLADGMGGGSLATARDTVRNLAAKVAPEEPARTATPTATPRPTPSQTTTPAAG